MASELKQDGIFLFDHQESDQSLIREEKPGFFRRIKQFISSRYALLAVIFLLTGSMIFYNTAALQLNPSAAAGVSETSGVARQQTVKAARGDIVDASGIPLAYSRSINVLQITYAGLDSDQLNAMLLDLAHFLEDHGVQWESELTDYLQLNHDGCTHAAGEGEDCGTPVFVKSLEDTLYWETKGNVLPLKTAAAGDQATFDNQVAKDTPELLYNYLLYKLFAIEDPEADGQRYSQADAFRIMCFRYLIYQNNWAFTQGTPLEIARDISDDVVQAVNEQNYRFKGVISSLDYERVYTDDAQSLSHVLGYVGRISSDQYNELKALGYASNAMVGQAGVESTAERYLAGQDGAKPYNIWTVAEEEGTFFSENIGKNAVSGNNVKLTIDLSMQQVAVSSLKRVIEEIRNSAGNKNKGDADAGAVVMLNAKTGAVLAMASYPSYDPNDFIRQSYDEEAAKRVSQYLEDNVNKPMWNRAMMEIYAPGSTFKPATAVAALETGVITPNSSIIRCKGTEMIGDMLWHCLEKPTSGHGDLTLTAALATSCNMYFYNLGVRTGINAIDEYGKKLGLGEYTGIDLPGEAKGFRSSRATKKLLRSNPSDQIWFPADTCQSAIGQFDNSFTVLQLAVYATALATGNKVTPHVVDTITGSDGVIIRQNNIAPVPIGLKDSTLAAVKAGMLAVVNDKNGTAYDAFVDFPIKVAAKTGTAETGFEDVSSSNGLFICYAPADDPEVVIAQIIEKGAWGSNTIGIAKDMLTAYFHLNDTAATDSSLIPGLADVVVSPSATPAPTPVP
ncbi:MAG: penicillin-binding transpeptidase domain-containing protein [Clostridiaceae bacterium]|nr:penicillin-binding transpeptidase domain-containing protein [Clostridiaceae bacterium]